MADGQVDEMVETPRRLRVGIPSAHVLLLALLRRMLEAVVLLVLMVEVVLAAVVLVDPRSSDPVRIPRTQRGLGALRPEIQGLLMDLKLLGDDDPNSGGIASPVAHPEELIRHA